MKVFLVFPPHWLPAMPHLALPTLTAHLRAQGVDVIQRDLNLEVFDTLLTSSYLETSVERLADRPLPEGLRQRWATRAPELITHVDAAKATLRDARFYDGRTSLHAFLTLVEALELASLPFYPSTFQFTTFRSGVPVDSSVDLLSTARNSRTNLFYDLFRTGIVRDIERERPDVVGISIPTLDQMLAGMTLAHLIKDAGISSHVVIGGPHVSMLREQIPKVPELFDFFDSAVLFDGEYTLLRLVEALETGEALSNVPNLIYREGGATRVTDTVSSEARTPSEAQDLLPDFDGLPLDRYLAPDLVLPLLSSRGCYHGKCAFCNVGYGGPNGFRMLDPELVVDQMVKLRAKYGARHFFFADEALTPRTLRVLGDRLGPGRAPDVPDDLHWCGCARLERGLTSELLQAMSDGGCRMLLFGLETAAPWTIDRIHKGTEPDVMSRVLRDSAAAGIWNHTFFFFGFPGETMETAQETVNFVYAHQDAIHSASPGAFLLERYSPVYCDPEAYDVSRVVEDVKRDLAIYFDYEVTSGIDEAMADTLASRLVDTLPKKEFGQYYIIDAYRFLYASHLSDYGRPMPLWLA